MSSEHQQAFSSPHKIVGVCGIIGAGKTTFSTRLAKELGFAQSEEEPYQKNPYLFWYYPTPQTRLEYGFRSQLRMLNMSFDSHINMCFSSKSYVSDSVFHANLVYALMLRKADYITATDFETYLQTYHNYNRFIKPVDLIVYLDVKPEVALERRINRGRPGEVPVDLSYLTAHKHQFEDWINGPAQPMPFIRVDWNKNVDSSSPEYEQRVQAVAAQVREKLRL
jgi:deoxyadenosine/deoxycytidine kinase